MQLNFEWHIPWPTDWDTEKKERAATKLTEYMRDGTFYETRMRMMCVSAEVHQPTDRTDPYIRLTLEN